MIPRRVLVMFVATAFAMAMAAIYLLLGRPYAALPDGAHPSVIVWGGDSVALDGTDLMDEPDKLPDYAAMETMLNRQGMLYDALTQPDARLRYTLGGETAEVAPHPRQLSDLPVVFWFQLIVGMAGMLVSGWLLALRPQEMAVRLFALTGVSLATSAMAAAVYSSRQVALPTELFRILSGLNHIGATWFGVGLIGMFLLYPRPLVRPVWLLVPAGLVAMGNVLHVARLSPVNLANFMVAIEALVALGLVVAQWRLSKRMPLDRAGLRYLVLATWIGVAGFVGLSIFPALLNRHDMSPVSQGYAFGFFLVMYVGIALGLARYRLFDLDRYAFRVWMWLGAGMMILVLDGILLLFLRDQPLNRFAIALILGSFLYFPMRQALMARVLTARSVSLQGHMPELLGAALERDPAARAMAWDALLRAIWTPLSVRQPEHEPDRPELRDEGMELHLPDACGVGARCLGHAADGRRLFNGDDLALAATLCDMVSLTRASSEAYDAGVTTERDRISRDMHDTIGAQLLSALHAREADRKDALLREALADMRGIIDADFAGNFTLAGVMADLRVETLDRLENSGIGAEWPVAPLPDKAIPIPVATALRAIVREAVSNTIRHSGARRMVIAPRIEGDLLRIAMQDNGTFTRSARTGRGLDNMRTRVEALGGRFTVTQDGPGFALDLALPVPGSSAREKLAAQ